MGSKIPDISLSNIFLIYLLRQGKNKQKQMVLIKLKRFCTAKETINKTKRQPTKWEKIFANDKSIKGLIPKIYKELIYRIFQTIRRTPKIWEENGGASYSPNVAYLARWGGEGRPR